MRQACLFWNPPKSDDDKVEMRQSSGQSRFSAPSCRDYRIARGAEARVKLMVHTRLHRVSCGTNAVGRRT